VRRTSIKKKGDRAKSLLIGYARVSTEDQNLELQLGALKKAGCSKVFTDKTSGAASDRPGWKEALSYLRETDTLVVWKLDRLGRSVKGLVDLVMNLESQQVHFKSLTDSIDTKTPAGRFFFHVMASLAQMERELIVERTRAGLDAAKKQGRIGGRKRLMTEKKLSAARKLLALGTPPREVAQNLGISVPTFYRWLPASLRAV
jgi:DNA invertase Pin-like site-specific DNA recombinase